MDIRQLRGQFLDYFAARGYQKVLAAPVIPENDPTVLFTTAGMQQFKPYYLEPSSAPSPTVATVQPVIRTSDIGEVGDPTHLTMFEMLGNFRFGEADLVAMKQRAIEEAWQFIHQDLGVNKDRVYATVFAGDNETPADEASAAIWQELGVKVEKAGREDNFWGPTGDEGPCGPTTEIYIDGIEVWNLVFNEFHRDRAGQFTSLTQAGLDTGSGLERLAATLQGKKSIWEIEPFRGWLLAVDPAHPGESRVIVDHLKAIVFLVSAGLEPANKGREYILRRLIRKVVFLGSKLAGELDYAGLIGQIRAFYTEEYPLRDPADIVAVLTKEKEQFQKNLGRADRHLRAWTDRHQAAGEAEVTELAFYMFESFGFPKELVLEHLVSLGYSVDMNHFAQLFKAHQEVSRAGLAGQFKGGLADHNEQTIKHHTAHHLLLAALRQVLGPTVVQRGSNVTSDRLRLDFSFERKLTDEELKKVEAIVNEQIQADLPVVMEQLPKEEALQSGALAEFGQKYGDIVTVYKIGDFSKELCGGPHVSKTGLLGRFEILKEEASAQGIRRIKAKTV